MFLADWSGRRVAAYAITWLVGFPVLMTAAEIIGAVASPGSGGLMIGTPAVHAPVPDSIRQRFDSLRREDSLRPVAFLPMQHSDVSVSLSVEATHDLDPAFGLDLLPWLLPPALLVAAWTWSRRSRPDPD